MSYAIGQVIFGIPLPLDEEDRGTILEEAVESEADGFLTYYSGHGDDPVAFGVQLDCIDEACYSIDISSIKLEPSDAQRREFYRLWEHLEDEVKTAIEQKFGQPRSFILWSTS